MRYLLLLIFMIPTIAMADCVTDENSGDMTCTEGNVSYVYPSQETLDARALIQADADAKTQAQNDADQVRADALQAVIDDKIAATPDLQTRLDSAIAKKSTITQQIKE